MPPTISRSLDPRLVEYLTACSRCPDCNSRVTVTESDTGAAIVDVRHQDLCPAHAALIRQDRTSGQFTVLLAKPGVGFNAFAQAVDEAAAELGPPLAEPVYGDLYGAEQ